MMETKFKETLKDRGQNLKWFYDKFVKEKVSITYGGFCHQLNGYAPVSDTIKEEIERYIGEKNGETDKKRD